jgi:hypothetical protein
MNTTAQNSFTSVISINPYKETYYTGVSSFLSETTSPEFSKDQFAISYLNTNSFITSQVLISKNIPEEDLFDAINSKIYDDLGLDQAIEYKVQFIESFDNLDEDNRYFHVFIVDPLVITETFAPIVDKIKYVDTIMPAPLLIKSLYTKEILDGNGTHCFVYFQENDAFVTIYNNQNFTYTKSIKYSFIEMHERFCELYGERIDYYDFIDFFATQSLKDTQSDYKEYLIKLYKEIFATVNDILTFARRAFDIDKFEKVYIGSQIDTVTKLDEMLEVELNVKTANFEFDYGFEHNDQYVDQLQSLMHLYTTLRDDEKYICNFSPFHRPPKFIKRPSGKFILLIAASFALAFAYPITYWVLTYAQELQKDLLQKQYDDLHVVRTTREATLKNKQADKVKATKLLAQEKTEYIDKKNTLIKIHEVKVNYPMKAKLLVLLTKDLNKFGVKVDKIIYSEEEKHKVFKLNLVASKDRKMTKLVEYLTKEYERKFNFSLDTILFDAEKKLYFTELKVEIL